MKIIVSVIGHAIHQYAKANNKSMKDYEKMKNYNISSIRDMNNLYGWRMS